MSKHTPGPWIVERGEGLELYVVAPEATTGIFGDVTGLEIAKVYANPQANARLIAAAPDLLETLREVLEHSGLLFHPGEDGCRMCDVRLKVEAAIAKAEGRS